ncbi:MAG: hypothetical protein VYB72_12650, partial [Planctomycetota bacterium]|nr:hypothetical protein [Planctomycetota bacterium]
MLDQLAGQITRVEDRCKRLRRLQWWSLAFIVFGLTSWLMVKPITENQFASTDGLLVLVGLLVSGLVVLSFVSHRLRFSRRRLATRLEKQFPVLEQRLLTAVEIQEKGGELGYLESEVVREALEHSKQNDWSLVVSRRSMLFVRTFCVLAFLFCAGSFSNTYYSVSAQQEQPETSLAGESGLSIVVEPGDVEVEVGTSLVITARYESQAPSEATLQIMDAAGNSRSLVMKRNLSDPVLGVLVSDIKEAFKYKVIDGSVESDLYQATVYQHPELVRSDAEITYPEYTQFENKTIENTVRVSAVQGSKVTWRCLLNKPVKQASLVEEVSSEALLLHPNKINPELYSVELQMDQTKKYSLVLVDQDGRENKFPPELTMRMISNEPVNLKPTLAGDSSVSPLEEFPVAAEMSDDFGILQFGLAYTFADAMERDVILGEAVPRGEKREADHLISFEALSAVPDDLLTYYFWAEDYAPDGTVRRTQSDLFFAEVRPFDEIFRERSPQQSASESQQSQQSQNGQQAEELANLQKEIINATWRLLRDQDSRLDDASFANDIQLVIDSQTDALNQTEEMVTQLSDEDSQEFGARAIESMNQVIETLSSVRDMTDSPELRNALQSETEAYSLLLKLRAREFEITQSQQQSSSSSSSSSSQSQRQRQIDELELDEETERYETEAQASQAQEEAEEDRETRQVLNRLRDLARRQEDLNDALAELQTTLESEDVKEKEEADRQIKRLREQQQDLLRETDELSERLQENSSQQEMNEAAEQLEQTREQVSEAAEQLAQNNAAEALTAGRRAEREFEQMRDEFRQNAAGQFNEAVREFQQEVER